MWPPVAIPDPPTLKRGPCRVSISPLVAGTGQLPVGWRRSVRCVAGQGVADGQQQRAGGVGTDAVHRDQAGRELLGDALEAHDGAVALGVEERDAGRELTQGQADEAVVGSDT